MAFETIVVGKGLIGSAACRSLTERGASVAIIGPDEPRDPANHDGVFASHYDQGRITRRIGRDSLYAKLAELAIDAYPAIERESGIRFHFPVGMLVVDAPHLPEGHMKDVLGTARALNRRFALYPPSDRSWKDRFPELEFPKTHRVIYEPGPAGYINPRDLIRAQLAIAERNGATIIRETVTRIAPGVGGYVVETHAGTSYETRKVLLAAGAFTPFHDLLPGKLPLEPETETVLLARVSDEDGERLSHLPTVIYIVDDPELNDVYMTPPIRYPDGHHYIKLGANSIYDERPATLEELKAWFRCGDSARCQPALERVTRSIWPGVRLLATETKRCILCRTPSGYPIIDEIVAGFVVAAGGNGGSAKSSDTLGRLAAGLTLDGTWPSEVPREPFRAP